MTAASFSPFSAQPDRVFYRVGGHRPALQEKLPIVEEIFNRILEPLYGPQKQAITKIIESKDRACFLLYEGDHPVGVLQFKTEPSDEFKEFGVTKSIEIKSLFVDHAQKNSGKGIGSLLMQQLFEQLAKLPSPYENIHVTVSEKKEESLNFFQKKGFKVKHAWEGRYTEGTIEYLLACPASILKSGSLNLPSGQSFKLRSLKDEPELYHVIHNAHFDDVLSLTRLTDGTFISGSKDNTINKWNGDSRDLNRCVLDAEPSMQTENNWITGVAKLNDDYWVSGSRSGAVSIWKTSGSFVRDISVEMPPVGSHKSMHQNARRVSCLAPSINTSQPGFFAGFPTMFDEVNFIENTSHSHKMHPNDWVFCIEPLSPSKLLCVVGASIVSCDKTDGSWQEPELVLAEPKPMHVGGAKGRQRYFIQSLKPIEEEKTHFALAFLTGTVGLLDLENKKLVRTWDEHKGRVWSALPLSRQLIASSSEDKTIRLWDTRQRASIHTITTLAGHTTAMLQWDDDTLIGAFSPDKIEQQPKSASQLRWYDLRK